MSGFVDAFSEDHSEGWNSSGLLEVFLVSHRDDVAFMVHVEEFDVLSDLHEVREIESLFCYSHELMVGVLISDLLGVVPVQYLHFGLNSSKLK